MPFEIFIDRLKVKVTLEGSDLDSLSKFGFFFY